MPPKWPMQKLKKTTAKIEISKVDRSEYFEAKGEVIKFDGFLKVYIEGTDDEDAENDNSVLPPAGKKSKTRFEQNHFQRAVLQTCPALYRSQSGQKT